MDDLRSRAYANAGRSLLSYLDQNLDVQVGYPDPPSWGYAYSYLAALSAGLDAPSGFADRALAALMRQDSDAPQFPWEFVVCALQLAKRRFDAPIPQPFNQYRAKGTRMFNWFMLRALNRQLCAVQGGLRQLQFYLLLRCHQDRSGFIYDEFRTRSLQYHAFCLCVLTEMITIVPDLSRLKARLMQGVAFSLRHVLPGGSALYIARGQEQIFGYGSLIYALEFCHHHIQPLPEAPLDLIRQYVLQAQRADGSFPLVLHSRHPEPPTARFDPDQPPGWYSYNTLFDYQPFLAYCLIRAGQVSC